MVSSPANPQSLNRYSYVLNRPLSYVDPSGHQDETPPLTPEIIDSWKYAEDITRILQRMLAMAMAGASQLMATLMAIHNANLNESTRLNIRWSRYGDPEDDQEWRVGGSYTQADREVKLNVRHKYGRPVFDSEGNPTSEREGVYNVGEWAAIIAHEVEHMVLNDRGLANSRENEYYAYRAGEMARREMFGYDTPGAGWGCLEVNIAEWVTDRDVVKAYPDIPTWGRSSTIGHLAGARFESAWFLRD